MDNDDKRKQPDPSKPTIEFDFDQPSVTGKLLADVTAALQGGPGFNAWQNEVRQYVKRTEETDRRIAHVVSMATKFVNIVPKNVGSFVAMGGGRLTNLLANREFLTPTRPVQEAVPTPQSWPVTLTQAGRPATKARLQLPVGAPIDHLRAALDAMRRHDPAGVPEFAEHLQKALVASPRLITMYRVLVDRFDLVSPGHPVR